MISAMLLKDRSSGPSSGTSPAPLQLSSSSRRDAAAAMSRVATDGSLRSPSIGEKNMPWFLIAPAWQAMLSMNDGLVSAL